MKLIFKYISRYKGLFILNLFAVVCIATAELGIPFIISNIIDDVLPQQDIYLVYRYVAILSVIAVLGGLGNIVLNFCASKTAAHILQDLRNDIFAKVQTLSPSDIQSVGTSSLVTRTMMDVFQILNFVTMFYRAAILAPLMFSFSIILIVVRAPQLTISVFIMAPIIALVLVLVIRMTKTLSERQQQQLDTLNLITRENLTGVRVVRAFRKSLYEQKRFKTINDKYTDTSVKMFRIMALIEPIFYYIFNISILVLTYLGMNFITAGSLSVGQLVEFLDYQFHVMFSILTFALLFMTYPKTMVSSSRIKAILEKEPTIKNAANATPLNTIKTIEFKAVSFKYPDADFPILKDINFTAKKGDVIAFVGSTGSGKSTLIQLIPRLHDITSGHILINNQNIHDLHIKDLRSRIGYILQKALLFQGTIRSNLLFAKGDATEEEMLKALEIAQGLNIVEEKPEGLDAKISELGSNLSGGQRQRISIARAIIKKPDVYIFDDSFSALDYKTDAQLRKALTAVTKDDIVLIVAQRLASVMLASKIIVMHQGQIVDQGRHEELLARCQIYQEIAKSQNLLEVVS